MDYKKRTAPKERGDENQQTTDLIEGRNAVLEALRAGRTVDKVYLASGSTDRALDRIGRSGQAGGRCGGVGRSQKARCNERHRAPIRG